MNKSKLICMVISNGVFLSGYSSSQFFNFANKKNDKLINGEKEFVLISIVEADLYYDKFLILP